MLAGSGLACGSGSSTDSGDTGSTPAEITDNPLVPMFEGWNEEAKAQFCEMVDAEGERVATMFLSNGRNVPAFTTDDLRNLYDRECEG